MDTWGEHSRPKEQGPQVGACLADMRNKEASVAREGEEGRRGWKLMLVYKWGQNIQTFVKTLAFALS